MPEGSSPRTGFRRSRESSSPVQGAESRAAVSRSSREGGRPYPAARRLSQVGQPLD